MANPGQSVLTIYPDRLINNWRWLDSQTASACRTAAVVKADAYGLGLAGIAPILHKAGCTDFCVAQLAEGIALRQLLPDVSIQVLEGLLPGTEAEYAAHQLTATLNDESQIARASQMQETGKAPPPWLHIDTGMARLGLTDLPNSLPDSLPDGLRLAGVMSHLACADQPHHRLNQQQLARFSALTSRLDGPASLAASGGILLGPDWHFDRTRAGIALYGFPPLPVKKGLQPVFDWHAALLQVFSVTAGQTVGYGADFIADKPMRLATIGAGYADGYARNLNGEALIEIAGHLTRPVGRISMDLTVVDVTAIPAGLLDKASRACLLGAHYTAEDMARDRGTISYEVMTGLGGRSVRHYDGTG